MTSRALAVWLALLAGAQFVAGAGNLTDLVPPAAAAWLQLIVGALGVATAVYTGKATATAADFGVRSSTLARLSSTIRSWRQTTA